MDNDYTVNTRKYLSKGDQIGDAYLTTDTLVFNIDDKKVLTDEDTYSVTNKDLFTDKDSYRTLIYDKDKDSNTAVIVNYGPKAVVNQKTPLSIVKSISQGVTVDGESKTKVTFYENKEEKSFFISSNVTIKKLKSLNSSKVLVLYPADPPDPTDPEPLPTISDLVKGTAFQYSMKNSEEIGSITLTANLNNLSTDFVIGDMETSDKYMVAYGKASARTTTVGVSGIMYKVDEKVNVYLYDKSIQKTFDIELSSIENDSMILVKLTNCKVTDIIKIK